MRLQLRWNQSELRRNFVRTLRSPIEVELTFSFIKELFLIDVIYVLRLNSSLAKEISWLAQSK